MTQYEYERFPELAILPQLTPQQQGIFLAQYHSTRKDEVIGVLLALLLGHFGAHRFYMGQFGWGLIYLLFCWTGIPTLLGFIECFLMPGRIREYNISQAIYLAHYVRTIPNAPAGALIPVSAYQRPVATV